MKKSTIASLIGLSLLAASVTAFADFDSRLWTRYCKASQENKDRCQVANQVCEQYPKADCDQIKTAFMERRSLDAILAEGEAKK